MQPLENASCVPFQRLYPSKRYVTWLYSNSVRKRKWLKLICCLHLSQSGYIDGPVLNTFRTNLVVLPMVMEYMQYIFIGLGLATILGAVILYLSDKVCSLLQFLCMLLMLLIVTNIIFLYTKRVCLCECMYERDIERKWVEHDVEQMWFCCLFVSEEVMKFSIRFSTLYHSTLTPCMGLDGLKCNICMVCFTESLEKDITFSHRRGQH